MFASFAFVALAACGGRAALTGDSDGGGATGAGGAAFVPRAADVVWPGAGCGQPLPANQVQTVPGKPTGYTHFTAMGTGANLTDTPIGAKAAPRTFWVRVPADYDPNKPYRLVYIGQGCGSFNSANTSTYQLYKESSGGTEQAIYVALDIPEDGANEDCYDDHEGLKSQEWEAFQLFQEFVDAHYCVDLNKIYVVGYSTGGWLANMWGCYFAGWPSAARKFAPTYHIRGQVAYEGGEPDEQPTCGGPIAALWVNDLDGVAHPISGDIKALARVGRVDGCDTTYGDASLQTPWNADDPRIGDVCKQFVGCPSKSPVVFCTTTGLGQSSQDARVIPAATKFFTEIESGDQPVTSDAGTTSDSGASDVGGCHPECALGQTACDGSFSLRSCVVDASGCLVWGPSVACAPNFVCCSTCGSTSVCWHNPSCPDVPAGCTGKGTFCVDGKTLGVCDVTTPPVSTTFPCTDVAATTPCDPGQTCDGSVPLAATCR